MLRRNHGTINKGIQGSQKDLFGNDVHMLNVKEVYRMVKCGKCERTVKSSQAKTHLSYGNMLTICKECLELDDKERKSSIVPNIHIRQINDLIVSVSTTSVNTPSVVAIS